MLQREEQTTVAIDDLASAAAASRPWSTSARLPRVEEALSRTFDRWLGDSEAKYTARAAAADRIDFTAHGRRIGYALCHGVYEDFDLRGSITLNARDELIALTVSGSATVTEDMCNNDGSARIKTGPYRATYEGHLDRNCSGSPP
jgi:hypothetical protein